MQRILIVAAVRQELEPFLKDGNGETAVLFTGIGGRRAYSRVSRWLSEHPCRLVVSAGFAGATQPGFRVGDLVLAEEVVEVSSNRKVHPSVLPESTGLRPVHRGRFVTVSKAALTPLAKAELGARFGAIGVDMETAWVAQAAVEKGADWVGIRAILDPMERFLWGPSTLLRGVPVARERLSAYLKAVIPSLH